MSTPNAQGTEGTIDVGTTQGTADPADLVCSARGCRRDATWGLRWNNPRLHTPERRKVWLACDDHREHLEAFLGARGFHCDTVAVSELDPTDG